jgi:hypothetical protein
MHHDLNIGTKWCGVNDIADNYHDLGHDFELVRQKKMILTFILCLLCLIIIKNFILVVILFAHQ